MMDKHDPNHCLTIYIGPSDGAELIEAEDCDSLTHEEAHDAYCAAALTFLDSRLVRFRYEFVNYSKWNGGMRLHESGGRLLAVWRDNASEKVLSLLYEADELGLAAAEKYEREYVIPMMTPDAED